MVEKKPEEQHWTEKASSNLEYYFDTEEGRKELSEMIKKETELQLKQIFTSKQGLKEIIWLSKYCDQCTHFTERRHSMKCDKFKAKIVKPFYGKPLWSIKISDIEELLVSDIDWNSKSLEVSEDLIKNAINNINNGFPYFCFKTREKM